MKKFCRHLPFTLSLDFPFFSPLSLFLFLFLSLSLFVHRSFFETNSQRSAQKAKPRKRRVSTGRKSEVMQNILGTDKYHYIVFILVYVCLNEGEWKMRITKCIVVGIKYPCCEFTLVRVVKHIHIVRIIYAYACVYIHTYIRASTLVGTIRAAFWRF